MWAGNTALCVKSFYYTSLNLTLGAHSRRREPTPKSCPLNSSRVPCHNMCMCTHVYTAWPYTNNMLFFFELFKTEKRKGSGSKRRAVSCQPVLNKQLDSCSSETSLNYIPIFAKRDKLTKKSLKVTRRSLSPKRSPVSKVPGGGGGGGLGRS